MEIGDHGVEIGDHACQQPFTLHARVGESAPHFQVWLVDCGPTRGPVMMAEVRVDVNRRGHDR